MKDLESNLDLKEEVKTEFIKVHRQVIAGYLMQRGFRLLRLEKNKNFDGIWNTKEKQKNDFVFKNSILIQKEIENYILTHKKNDKDRLIKKGE